MGKAHTKDGRQQEQPKSEESSGTLTTQKSTNGRPKEGFYPNPAG